MKFRDFIRIIESNGFRLERQKATSHRIYKRVTKKETRLVTVACHRLSDDIKPGTLSSMIRRSGLPKRLFR